jgi:hypothetical protein
MRQPSKVLMQLLPMRWKVSSRFGKKLMHEVFKVYHLKLVKTNCWGYIQEDIVG